MQHNSIFLITRFLFWAFMFVAPHSSQANNYPPVTPDNINEVVQQIYADYGAQIDIAESDVVAFLSSVQPDFDPDLATPVPTALNGGPSFATFGLEHNDTYAAGYIDLAGGATDNAVFAGNTYTFDGLNGENLHLFVFMVTNGDQQGAAKVVITQPTNIIIIDMKVISVRCDNPINLFSGNGSIIVPIALSDTMWYRVSIGLSQNSPAIDVFRVKIVNYGTTIDGGLFHPADAPENIDNYITPSGCVANNSGTRAIRFAPRRLNNSTIYNAFEISDEIQQVANPISIRLAYCPRPNATPPPPPAPGAQRLPVSGPIAVFPNPVQHTAIIDLESIDLTAAQLALTDAAGQLLARYPLAPDAALVELDFEQLPPGLYFVQVSTAQGIHHAKVLKAAE